MALAVTDAPAQTLNGVVNANPAPINGSGNAPTMYQTQTAPGAVATWSPNSVQSVQAAPNAAPGTGGTGGVGSPDRAAQINSAYDIGSNYYKGLLPTVAPRQANDTAHVDQFYGAQQDSLGHQRDAAFASLDNQQRVANESYTKNLALLGNQVRNTYQGQQNALGTQGAGDSSATGMLGYALGQQQNQQRGYMNQDVNNQMTQIGLTRDADKNQFDDQTKILSGQHQTQLDNIANTYGGLVQQINTQLANNEQARLQALNMAGQWAQGQAAGINTDIEQRLNSATNAFNPANMPKVAMAPMADYQAHNVAIPTVSAQSDLSRPVNTDAPVQQIYSPYKQQTQPGF